MEGEPKSVEISPLVSVHGENLSRLRNITLQLPCLILDQSEVDQPYEVISEGVGRLHQPMNGFIVYLYLWFCTLLYHVWEQIKEWNTYQIQKKTHIAITTATITLSRFRLSPIAFTKLSITGSRDMSPITFPRLDSKRLRWPMSWLCDSTAWLESSHRKECYSKYESAIWREEWIAPRSFNNVLISDSSEDMLDIIQQWEKDSCTERGFSRLWRSLFNCKLAYCETGEKGRHGYD